MKPGKLHLHFLEIYQYFLSQEVTGCRELMEERVIACACTSQDFSPEDGVRQNNKVYIGAGKKVMKNRGTFVSGLLNFMEKPISAHGERNASEASPLP